MQDTHRFWRAFDGTLDSIAFVCKLITGISLVVLTVIFGWLVYGRYVLNATPTWVEQVAFLLVMVIAFLGSAVGVHEHTHLSVSILRTSVMPHLRRLLMMFTDVVMGGFGLLMAWYGTQLTIFKWGSEIPLLHLPEGLRSLPLALAGGLIFLFSVGHLVRILRDTDLRTDIIE
ncbi:TRAP transporter small permease [Marinovum sp. 2_MG-2023]|uniref:TRAP transporter small permease n=1 Tax=unclassified Marinovum TaxID=2647166 RepID=UPI0026E11AC8|nr:MULTISPECIES: TRAP transporter small permease [unclassified Marinovum]MDO6731247.1 TRAP transporter small permease [Marinovum sp. 2_MG-2023]MDO6780601.1 TRAP transporter small permease [Marinovum sp. 1_MG-2023]